MSEFVKFSEDTEEEELGSVNKWKVLVVDDEPTIHEITKNVFEKWKFEEREVEILCAHDFEETKKIFKENEDIAVVLLDIVMEDDMTGIEIINFIRNTIRNKKVRIIVRTGESMKIPEKGLVFNYDINDYRDKTELTATKLKSIVLFSLRNYRDIINFNRYL